MTVLRDNICVMCRWLRPFAPGQTITCQAFPNGIPVKFLNGSEDHIVPEPGDNGIQFEAKSGFRVPTA